MITGDTGTGKELAAELIHRHSQRRHAPFVRVNCAALPDTLIESELFGHEKGAFTGAITAQRGKFEQAHEGTIFLDEIGDMSMAAQAKILRVLENKEVCRIGGTRRIPLDARVIAATNQRLEEMAQAKTFRDDLYYRLNVARIDLPLLKDRKEDVPLLLAQYLHEMNGRFQRHIQRFSADALAICAAYHWPGNVRELQAELKRYIVSRELSPHLLPSAAAPSEGKTLHLPEAVSALERRLIAAALDQSGGERSKAAQLLGIDRKTLYRKLKEYKFE